MAMKKATKKEANDTFARAGKGHKITAKTPKPAMTKAASPASIVSKMAKKKKG